MQAASVAIRYAKALFGLARDREVLDPVYADLRDLERLLRDCPDFARFTADPRIPPAPRAAALDALFRDRAHPLTLRFLSFLDSKDRLGHLPGICRHFAALFHLHRGILEVRITSATPLTPEQVSAIETRLHARFGKQIQSTLHLDPALLGGFKIQVGDTIHDSSIATQLHVLKQNLIHA
jgi:F-type H+-transporting ATPase subunit delta